MASNQVEARKEAKQAYDDAKAAGVTGPDLAVLKAAYDAAEAAVRQTTGSNGGWGIFS